jgi:predicted nuclease with TOPRIM domain
MGILNSELDRLRKKNASLEDKIERLDRNIDMMEQRLLEVETENARLHAYVDTFEGLSKDIKRLRDENKNYLEEIAYCWGVTTDAVKEQFEYEALEGEDDE